MKRLWPKGAAFALVAVIAAAAAATAGAVSPTVVYDNIPSPQPANVPSVGGEAYAFAEFGGQVQLAPGNQRMNPTVTVLMSSWGCQSGTWFDANCITTPGATFSQKITLNLYNVGSGGSVGSLIATSTQTFAIPYRPSTSGSCTGGRWFNASDSTCYNGLAAPISFTFAGVTLPNNVIVGVAYNTTHFGYSPIGESAACYSTSAGCPYDSLNVGLSTASPTVGTDPQPNGVYQNSPYGGEYCDSGAGGTNTFRLDAGCWAPYQPAFRISAVYINVPTSKDDCKGDGWKTRTRADGSTFKNQGDCIQYVNTGK